MQYMLLIYTDDTQPAPGDANFEQYIQGYADCAEDFRGREIMISGEGLQGVETATSVRVGDGGTNVTDGPFAETKETLGGFYIVDCKDLDEAIACAEKIPGAKHGCVEIRPVMVFD